MTDNTAKDSKGKSIDVYENDIHRLFDEYVSSLDSDIESCNIQIYRTPIFKGALKYIYNNRFKIGPKDIKYNNKNSNLDYSDIDTIDGIWDIYTALCYKYRQNPTLLNFSIMTGIAHATLTDWTNGNCRNNEELGSSHCQSAKKWLKECESAAYDVAMSGNPGGMFILKANYGYTEAPQQIQIIGQDQGKSIEQIVAEHSEALLTGDSSVIDEPPSLEL